MKQETSVPGDNSFWATLQRHRGGALLSELSDVLRDVVAGVNATGKVGTMTLTIRVQPAIRGHAGIMVTDKLVGKVPTIEAEASYWFGTADGELCKDDPRQREFKMSMVASPAGTPDANEEDEDANIPKANVAR